MRAGWAGMVPNRAGGGAAASAGATQNVQPGGGLGHAGSGCHPGGGVQPAGGAGQLAGT